MSNKYLRFQTQTQFNVIKNNNLQWLWQIDENALTGFKKGRSRLNTLEYWYSSCHPPFQRPREIRTPSLNETLLSQ